MAASDNASAFTGGMSAPSTYPEAIVNDIEFTYVSRGMYVGVGGDVTVIRMDNLAVQFKNAVAGSILPVRAKKVTTTGTTATNLVALA